MNATFPTGMTERARFIEGAVGFRLSAIRRDRRLMQMTDEEILAKNEASGMPGIFLSPESERFYAEQTVARGFRMEDVRSYADDIMSEH